MKLTLSSGNPLEHKCSVLVAGCFEKNLEAPFIAPFDQAFGGWLGSLSETGEFTGKLNKSIMIHTLGRVTPDRLLLVGLGKKGELTGERMRQAAGSAVQVMRKAGLKNGVSILHLAGGELPDLLRAEMEGYLLGGYSFDHYKTDPDIPGCLEGLTILVNQGAEKTSEKIVSETVMLCESVIIARELVDQPANVATPSFLAEKAVEVSGRYGLECRVMEREEMEQNGMAALLAVAKGSCQPPRFIILEHRSGKEKDKPIVLVGKGVTFDSGGISLKPGKGMEMMKDDMAGGAAVIGTLTAAARMKIPVNLVGLIPAVENLPDGRAYKPGDLVKSMSGKTIEIVNTDAEGRMILCDALHYAQRYKPAALIDLATLTGACVVALGSFATGLMSNDDGLTKALKKAGEASGERLWELPLWEEYGELMKSDIADMKNAGGPEAGTISAAWFLKQFVGKTRWAHLDIAGTAWEEKGRPYLPKGATGVGVRLLVEYLRGISRT